MNTDGGWGARFDEFFRALWGYPAFAWQRALAERVLTVSDPWPEVMALPTASGKTACVDVAVFALAMHPERHRMPRRVFFAVDRRLIVDAAYDRALAIARKLYEASNEPNATTPAILRDVAQRLKALGGDVPLMAYELRGGIYRSEAWARSPVQPIVVATTVDQLGSRLLFRAYGRRPYSFPIYAGLVANDSLVLLDEAHCAVPFMETLQAVRRYRTFAEQPLAAPFHTVVMSATPPAGLADVFRDTSGESDDPEHLLGKRRWATKETTLATAHGAGRDGVAEELAASARRLATDEGGHPQAVVVFCNRVRTARRVASMLRPHADTVLLTGRMRPIDRDDAVSRDLAPVQASCRQPLERPLFVVATQTLEVGADLDFDQLVTECAALDALQQRLGRLNRMGRAIDSRAVVVMERDVKLDDPVDDPIYGTALANTWRWLNDHVGPDDTVDMSIGGLDQHLRETRNRDELAAPVHRAPVMLPAHVDQWVQTSPIPWPSPDPGVFLHGPETGAPDVLVCWRADLGRDTKTRKFPGNSVLDAVASSPPAVAECVPVPIYLMCAWMAGSLAKDDSGDVEGQPDPARERSSRRHADLTPGPVIRWRGRDNVKVTELPEDIRPGDVVVLDSREDAETPFGDLPTGDGDVAGDWGDRANFETRGLPVLRIYPAVVGELPNFPSRAALMELATTGGLRFENDPDGLTDDVRQALQAVADDSAAPKWLITICKALTEERRLDQCVQPHPLGTGLIVRGSVRREPDPIAPPDAFTDEDHTSTVAAGVVTLGQHLKGVGALARRFAQECGLPEPLVEAVASAGALHDLGKADPRFQSLLTGGGRWSWDEPLAKSRGTPLTPKAYREALKRSGYPEGGRHELLSARMLEAESHRLPDNPELRDLVMHLVATHHGRSRPFAPVVEDPAPVDVAVPLPESTARVSSATGLERLDSGVTERFWRLVRRYGWWGLAWLEAILRLADHRQSEAEQKKVAHRSRKEGRSA